MSLDDPILSDITAGFLVLPRQTSAEATKAANCQAFFCMGSPEGAFLATDLVPYCVPLGISLKPILWNIAVLIGLGPSPREFGVLWVVLLLSRLQHVALMSIDVSFPRRSDSIPCEVTFKPGFEKAFNFNVVCNVKRKKQPVVLNVKGIGYKIHAGLAVEESETSGRREINAGGTNPVLIVSVRPMLVELEGG